MLKALTDDFISGKVKAIQNLGGMESLYYKHLKRFQDKYQDSHIKINRYLDLMEYEEAERLTHSIKGLAGTLGMSELESKCQTLETALNEGRYTELHPMLLEFQSALFKAIH
ncbi:MAG: Hpt domain-containing protein [Clostridiales bacterium]|jgi:two-component system sensor histidine kinase/response regulator|nr:Hpt domain-containing protein [Clostridiales bacterium]